MAIKDLPDEQLIDSYNKAIDLELDSEFIKLLYKEIEKRELKQEVIDKSL